MYKNLTFFGTARGVIDNTWLIAFAHVPATVHISTVHFLYPPTYQMGDTVGCRNLSEYRLLPSATDGYLSSVYQTRIEMDNMGALLVDRIKVQHFQGADAVLRGAINSSSSYGNENWGKNIINHYTNLLCWVLLKLSKVNLPPIICLGTGQL